MADATWLVVGLGNIGEQYQKTRHNVGVMAAKELAFSLGEKFSRHKKTNAFIAEGKKSGSKIIIAYLDCYMNESGGPINALMQFFNISHENLIVLHDELDLEFSELRIKYSGGDNGHNGLKSIRSVLDTGDFYRLRLGIGRPLTQQEPASYVLEKFSKSEEAKLEDLTKEAASATETLIHHGLSTAQNTYNKKAGDDE